MISFFIDTTTNTSTLAILKDKAILKMEQFESNNDISIKIFDYIEKLFLDFDPKEIEKIYVANGPGSFTGIRIGVTIAKTYAWSLNIKIVPISKLEIISSTLNEKNISIIDARRGFVYAGMYDENLNNLLEDQYIKLEELKEKYPNIEYVEKENINIEKIIKKHLNDEGINPHKTNPNYLKKTEAEENLNLK